MATQTTVRLVDDVDGTDADETVEFGIDGRTYEIDLATKRATELRDILAEFVACGRRVGGPAARKPRQRSGTTPAVADREQTQAKRDWARANGFTVSDRGRIPSVVDEAYNNRANVTPAPTVTNDTQGDDADRKLSSVPSPFEAPETAVADDADEKVLAWWTGVLKKPEPKGSKVTAPMRRQYRAEVLGA